MNKSGFTLTELLIAVIIVGVLTSIALPQYMRSVERARATEAMASVKAINDAVYAYYADKEECPSRFSQLVVNLPSTYTAGGVIDGKHFRFTLSGASANVAGTDCRGVLATRDNTTYKYTIWNPYTSVSSTDTSMALQCEPTNASDTKSKAVCESLGLYREPAAN